MYRYPIAAAVIAATSTAALASPYWSAISTGCVPDNVSIQADRYRDLSDSTVAPKSGAIDRVVLICGVAPNAGGQLPNAVSLTYLDPTGTATSAYVSARLVSVLRNTAARSVIATVWSDSFTTSTLTRKTSAKFSHVLNFANAYYFVRIEMDRTTATEDVRAVGVALETLP